MKFYFTVFLALCTIPLFSMQMDSEQVLETQLHNAYKDYPAYPNRDFTYTKAHVKLRYQEEKEILQGLVTYMVEPLWKEAKELRLLALHMQIDDVRINNEPTNYSLQDDTLIIQLNRAKALKQFSLEIIYQTDISYGLHKDLLGGIWTSNQPYATAHYLPGVIHPANQLLILAEFELPPKWDVAAPGKRLADSSTNQTGLKTVRWQTEKPIAITDFKFAMGLFEVDEVQFGIKKVRLFSYKNRLSSDKKNRLLTRAYEQLRRTENILDREYPYASFTMVHLQDSRWETKPYAASMGFVFANQPHEDIQIDRLVTAQWFGVYKQMTLWEDARFDVYWQAWFQARLWAENQIDASKIQRFEEPFVSDYSWNYFIDFAEAFMKPENERWFYAFQKSATSILDKSNSTLFARDYADVLYRVTGRLFNHLEIVDKPLETSVPIKVQFKYDESKKELSYRVIADSLHALNFPINAELITITAKGRPVKKITFQKEGHFQRHLSLDDVFNAYVNVIGEDSFSITYEKPKAFWIHQLRNEPNSSQRFEALRELQKDSLDTDFQLILGDLMRTEKEPIVLAEMISLYAKLTKGATGTDQFFLDQFRNENPLIKKAALQAFDFFPENEPMYFNALQVLKAEKDTALKLTALKVLQKRMNSTAFEDLVIKQINSETQMVFLPRLFSMLENLESSDKEKKRAIYANFTKPSYPFSVRKSAIENYLELVDYNPDNDDQLFDFFSDNDPRIRYAMTEILHRFPIDKQRRILENRLLDEYDYRIRDRLIELSRKKTAEN